MKLKVGEQLTKWERRELGLQLGIARRRLNKELKALNTPNEEGISRVQMGSIEARTIEARLKKLNSLESKTGYQFENLKKTIKFQGSSDYTMKKAIVYRENYLNVLERYENFDNYDKLMEKLKSINNPIEFFEYVSKNELTEDLYYQSNNFYSQQEFNRFVADIIGEENLTDSVDIVKDFMDFKYESFKDDEISF